MAKFVFKLEAVLRQRTLVEREKQREVASRQKILKQYHDELRDLNERANATTDEKCHVFLAEGVELAKKPETEASETLETRLVPVAEALEMARRGKMKTAPCALAVLLCEPHLTGKSARAQRTPNELLET